MLEHVANMRAALVLVLFASACARHEPPAPAGSPSIALPEVAPAPSSGAPVVRATAAASASSGPPPVASTPPAVDPAALPQTRDRPAASGEAFEARVAALWSAIALDEPERAMPFFFPLGAYQQVKDVSDPASDWKRRLVAAYGRDIHALHRRLGADAGAARLVGLEVPDARARWVEPDEEYNKLGYYRVFGSRLRYEIDGATRTFEVKSLISWRGTWYVVHLSAIQ